MEDMEISRSTNDVLPVIGVLSEYLSSARLYVKFLVIWLIVPGWNQNRIIWFTHVTEYPYKDYKIKYIRIIERPVYTYYIYFSIFCILIAGHFAYYIIEYKS